MTLFENEYLEIDVDDCLDKYFAPKYQRTREAVAMGKYLTDESLKGWAIAFNLFLVKEGNIQKQFKDWMKHFNRWLALQDTSQPPHDNKAVKGTKLQQNLTANLSAKEKNRLLHERNSNNQ